MPKIMAVCLSEDGKTSEVHYFEVYSRALRPGDMIIDGLVLDLHPLSPTSEYNPDRVWRYEFYRARVQRLVMVGRKIRAVTTNTYVASKINYTKLFKEWFPHGYTI